MTPDATATAALLEHGEAQSDATDIVAPESSAVSVNAMVLTAHGTDTLYEKMFAANDGINVPELVTKLAKSAFEDGSRLTARVYVLIVTPSWAVTSTFITVVAPAASIIVPEALPDVTTVPFTATEANDESAVGVTVSELTAFSTDIV